MAPKPVSFADFTWCVARLNHYRDRVGLVLTAKHFYGQHVRTVMEKLNVPMEDLVRLSWTYGEHECELLPFEGALSGSAHIWVRVSDSGELLKVPYRRVKLDYAPPRPTKN